MLEDTQTYPPFFLKKKYISCIYHLVINGEKFLATVHFFNHRNNIYSYDMVHLDFKISEHHVGNEIMCNIITVFHSIPTTYVYFKGILYSTQKGILMVEWLRYTYFQQQDKHYKGSIPATHIKCLGFQTPLYERQVLSSVIPFHPSEHHFSYK